MLNLSMYGIMGEGVGLELGNLGKVLIFFILF